MNDWSMRSSLNALEQSIEQDYNKPTVPAAAARHQQQTAFIRSQSQPLSLSPQQQLPNNNNNNSPNSSTTSSSSSVSLKRMKDSQRTTSGIETKEARPQSPLNLYKIFQQKSQIAASSSPRSAFQLYRQQTDSIVPNNNDNMTISGETMISRQKKQQTNPGTDQGIQTSIFLDSSSNSQMNSRFQPTPTIGIIISDLFEKKFFIFIGDKFNSSDHLSANADSNSSRHLTVPSRPSPLPISSSAIHKSLPDLAFISQYSKELPRSRTTSPLPSTSIPPTPSSSITPSSIIIQESERPRTLKSIKRYKNSKHSTEPLGVFYSPQLRKTFAAVPASAVINGGNDSPKLMKMKLPPPSSYPTRQQQQQHTSTLKSCLKYGSRATSCDIQAMLQDRKSPPPPLVIPEPTSNKVRRDFIPYLSDNICRNHYLLRQNVVVQKLMFRLIVRIIIGHQTCILPVRQMI
jgi:hypothetical protein